MTYISIVDSPCGYGKSTGLIAELKRHRINNPSASILIVVPELDEVDRFIKALYPWFKAPVVGLSNTSGSANKSDALIELMTTGKNIVTTHALYGRIKKFQHLLKKYYVVIDEVPTTAEEVRTNFGPGVFKNLLNDKQYISIDPITQIITPTSHWLLDEKQYSAGTDVDIQKFMNKVSNNDVYYVNDTYQVMPLPDVFFTEPKSLTILTFMFKGTQLDYYMSLRGYSYHIQRDPNELSQFKWEMNNNLNVYHYTAEIHCGYLAMTQKKPKVREKVGKFIRNTLNRLNKSGLNFKSNQVLVACSKDAWFGKDCNANSEVTNDTKLQRLSRLTDATYTPMVTRGTNKFRHFNTMILMGKLNMNPSLAEFLGMNFKSAKDSHATSELIQLIYRTEIRDKKDIFLISADPENLNLLRTFVSS